MSFRGRGGDRGFRGGGDRGFHGGGGRGFRGGGDRGFRGGRGGKIYLLTGKLISFELLKDDMAKSYCFCYRIHMKTDYWASILLCVC